MTEERIAFLIVVGLSVLTVLADILIKKAADANQIFSVFLLGGALIYGFSAFGWFYALRSINLATLGGIYSLTTVLLLVLSGIVFFDERLRPAEIGVILMAFVSILWLWRFL